MTAPSFTPGPWESSPCFERRRGDSYVILAHDGISVAECWVDAPSNDHEAKKATAADARLIAAAPDLYAALAGLANALECPSAMKGRTLVDVPNALKDARAALAKAVSP